MIEPCYLKERVGGPDAVVGECVCWCCFFTVSFGFLSDGEFLVIPRDSITLRFVCLTTLSVRNKVIQQNNLK